MFVVGADQGTPLAMRGRVGSSEQERVQPSTEAHLVADPTNGKQRAADIRLCGETGIMAHHQTLAGSRENDLGGHHETW